MKPGTTAIVGAAETTSIGTVPDMSQLQLCADAALNALEDAGLAPGDIDGLATLDQNPANVAFYLGIRPTWIDNTSVGGCSVLNLLRHAAAAIEAGHSTAVLITHGESGRSRVGGPYHHMYPPATLPGQFDVPFGMAGAASYLTLPVLRYMREFGISEEQLANVAVVQREWAADNPRALFREPITVADVLESPMIAYPFRRLMCCPITDGGGAVIVTRSDRAEDLSEHPVYVLGTGEAADVYDLGIAYSADPLRPRIIRDSGELAFREASISCSDVDHVMIYDAFAHLPLMGLEGLGFVDYGEAADFIWERHTARGGKLPLNTNGGGLSYTHSGSYGVYALIESIRQLRGEAAAQVPGVQVSLTHAFGNLMSACATIILGNHRP